MGVWLPIALAEIYQVLVAHLSVYSKEIKVPSVSEALHSFALPALSEAMRGNERERKGRELVERLRSMAEKTGGKFKIEKGGKT